MKYLSRISLDTRSADTRALIELMQNDRYAEHQHLWRVLSDDPETKRDFLFRREQDRHVLKYFVLSDRPPAGSPGLWVVDTKEFAPQFKSGQKLAFMLRANPVVTRHDENDKHKRHDVVMYAKKQSNYSSLPPDERPTMAMLAHEEGIKWLVSRSERHGFACDEESIVVSGYRQHWGRKRRNGQQIRFSTLDFEGKLVVTDPEKFTEMLFCGLGPAKSFGCALMLVRRL